MIVFTLTAQRFVGDKPTGELVTKRYASNGFALDWFGAAATLEQQSTDEMAIKRGYGRKGIELYRDLAYSLGVRRPGWPEQIVLEDHRMSKVRA